MSLLSNATTGKIKKPVLAVIYGPSGVGKSTFAANAPKPIFICAEDGTDNLNVARFPKAESYEQVMTMIQELITEKHSYESLAIDSLDWVENLVHQAVCDLDGSKTVNKAQGGYGNGASVVVDYWIAMQKKLTELRDKRKMNIILIAHSHVKPFHDPTQNMPYDRFTLKLNEKAAAKWMEFSDSILFANFEIVAKKEKSEKKAKTFGGESRKLYTEYRPSHDAKNRLGLPFEIQLDWKVFTEACGTGEIVEPVEKLPSLDEVMTDIKKLAVSIKETETAQAMAKAVEKAGGNIPKLVEIRNHARTIAGLNA